MTRRQRHGYSIVNAAGKVPEVRIYGYIGAGYWDDGVTAKDFAADIEALGDVDEIDVRINSGGGSVFDGVDMYNTLVQCGARITINITGVCASIAALIAQAGDERCIADNAHFMVHPVSGGCWGTAAELRQYLKLLDNADENSKRIFAARTGLDNVTLDDLLSKDSWLTASRAQELGFVDTVTEASKTRAHVTAENYSRPVNNSQVGLSDASRALQTLAAIAAELPTEVTEMETPAPANNGPASPAQPATPAPAAPTNPAPANQTPAAQPTSQQPAADAPTSPTPATGTQPAAAVNPTAPAAPSQQTTTVVVDAQAAAMMPTSTAAEIANICNAFGCPEQAGNFLKAGNTVDQVRQYVCDRQIQQRALSPAPAPGDTPAAPKNQDPKTAFEAEYDQQAKVYQTAGISKEAYVASRMVDEGHQPLATFTKPAE